MPERVLVRAESGRKARLEPDVRAAWRWIGWFGLLLAVVGGGDFALAWYPLRFGNAEWEFGTVAASFAGLPLVTMGLAALLGSAVARGVRWQVLVLAWFLILFGVGLLGAYIVFLLDVPLALQATEGIAALGIKKAIVKTTLLAVGFVGAYVGFGIGALRYERKNRKRGTDA